MDKSEFFKNPILIYSNYCKFSDNFIKLLSNCNQLYEIFRKINIDVDKETKKRPIIYYEIQNILQIKITKVPTVITPNAEYVLTDENAFKWLNFEINKLKENNELSPFNPNEMINFSDKYSKFGSTDINETNEQNYKYYVNKALSDDNILNNKTTNWSEGKTFGFLDELEDSSQNMDYETFKNNRDSNFQQPQPQQNENINFTEMFSNTNDKFLNKNGSMKINKSMELDQKLQQLQLDREKTDKLLKHQRKMY